MTLWVLFAAMSLVAVGFAVWPLYKHQKSLTPLIAVAVVVVVALSSGLYYYNGKPDLPSGTSSLTELDDTVRTWPPGLPAIQMISTGGRCSGVHT